jgi:glycosyltransferase involved in cell wall biosynthesis
MPRLRLLIFSPYFPPHVGGLEGYVSDLNDALLNSRAIEQITVFTPQLPKEAVVEERPREDYTVVRYPAFELIPNFPVPKLWELRFWRALRRARPQAHEVFVSHTRFFLTSFFAVICARAVRRPLIHVEHGSDFVQLASSFSRNAARAYDLTLGRLVLRRAQAVVAISRAAAEFVRQLAGRDASVIYRGMWKDLLDEVMPDEEIRERADGRIIITFAGRLIDGKGVSDLLRAFAAAEGTHAFACIVGDGPRRSELELLARSLCVHERVWFSGGVPEGRARSIIRASDVVVNPSYTEGLPTSVLEAALMGKAVLATDVGGTREIVSDTRSAVLVPPRDTSTLRCGLEALLADPGLRRRLGHAAQTDTRERFDWQTSAANFVGVARRVVADQAGAGSGAVITSSNTDS